MMVAYLCKNGCISVQKWLHICASDFIGPYTTHVCWPGVSCTGTPPFLYFYGFFPPPLFSSSLFISFLLFLLFFPSPLINFFPTFFSPFSFLSPLILFLPLFLLSFFFFPFPLLYFFSHIFPSFPPLFKNFFSPFLSFHPFFFPPFLLYLHPLHLPPSFYPPPPAPIFSFFFSSLSPFLLSPPFFYLTIFLLPHTSFFFIHFYFPPFPLFIIFTCFPFFYLSNLSSCRNSGWILNCDVVNNMEFLSTHTIFQRNFPKVVLPIVTCIYL